MFYGGDDLFENWSFIPELLASFTTEMYVLSLFFMFLIKSKIHRGIG